MTYKVISFPEIQIFMNHPRWDECIFINDERLPDSSYMVPIDLHDEVFNIQDPVVKLLEEVSNYIGMTRFELGEDYDSEDLESRVSTYLSIYKV